MIVTIISSLVNKEEIEAIKNFFKNQGCTAVNAPLEGQSKSLLEIDMDYLNKIDSSDFVIAIPKGISHEDHAGQIHKFLFGESVTYEIAYARHIGKPVFIWGGAGEIVYEKVN